MRLLALLKRAWAALTYDSRTEIVKQIRARGPFATVYISGREATVKYHRRDEDEVE